MIYNISLFICLLATISCNQSITDESADTEKTASKERKLHPLTLETAVDSLTAFAKNNPDSIVVISTRHGDMKVRLYSGTPLHRANFLRLVKSGYYDQGEFFRVVPGFAIQGGDSDKRTMKQGPYRIPQEVNTKYYHKKGALAMARYGDERNPAKESSSNNFYLVQGKVITMDELRAYEAQKNIKYTPEQIKTYTTIGGEPSLDQEYTVFGEVIEGLEVIDSIAQEPTDAQSWPKEVVKHTMKITNK